MKDSEKLSTFKMRIQVSSGVSNTKRFIVITVSVLGDFKKADKIREKLKKIQDKRKKGLKLN